MNSPRGTLGRDYGPQSLWCLEDGGDEAWEQSGPNPAGLWELLWELLPGTSPWCQQGLLLFHTSGGSRFKIKMPDLLTLLQTSTNEWIKTQNKPLPKWSSGILENCCLLPWIDPISFKLSLFPPSVVSVLHLKRLKQYGLLSSPDTQFLTVCWRFQIYTWQFNKTSAYL